MKKITKTVAILTVALMILSAGSVFAQQRESDGKNSASLETLKEDLLKLGQDLKISADEIGGLISQWLSETGASLEDKASTATIQSKLGVVLGTNKENLTVTIVKTDGKTLTFATTEETIIKIQDAVTGLQTPFAGGKNAKFRHIKKGSWINCSYNLKDAVQNIFPNANGGPIVVQKIDILR